MVFEDVVAVLERAFKLELSVVQDTTVFEVASEDGGTVSEETKGIALEFCLAMQSKPDLLTRGNRSIELEDAFIKLKLEYNDKISADISPDTNPLIGSVKFTAKMTIKNASDAELGDKMPEFTIDDFTQVES